MPADEKRKKKNEQSNKILKTVEEIREFNKQNQKIKAENNSEKLKNEIRKLLYSLYGSKKLTRQLYKSLINII